MRLSFWRSSRRGRERCRKPLPMQGDGDCAPTSALWTENKLRAEKRRRLESAGWRVGGTQQFLGLSDDGAQFVEIKLALAWCFRQLREKHHWTQAELAKHVGSSQSRVAKMEAADPTV